jgi:stage III sporulation protein AG
MYGTNEEAHMKSLMKIFRKGSQKVPLYLGLIVATGVMLLLFNQHFSAPPDDEVPILPPVIAQSTPTGLQTYERALERRLEEALALVEGVGRVRVLVSFERGRETVIAIDRNTSQSTTQEQDAHGGVRYSTNQTGQDNTVIITDRSGTSGPLVLREIEPVIGGVMIIAEGGDDIVVRDALIRATSSLLGVNVNRVHVMQMRDLPHNINP